MSTQQPKVGVLLDVLKQGKELDIIPTLEKSTLRKAAHHLAELCKRDDCMDLAVESGAIEVLVPLLDLTAGQECGEYQDVEKEVCIVLGLMAVKPHYQMRIAQQNALPGLVGLLKRHGPEALGNPQPTKAGVIRRSADAITNLAHENGQIKNMVRDHGGIPPLVSLLECLDIKIQRAAAGALRTLAFKNEANKKQMIDREALRLLIPMLRSDDVGVHYEAVGVLGNLVHSSSIIKRQVLHHGALQPVIGLLSSRCHDSQREAALLLGQFASTDPDIKNKIVQRGAIPPLIAMLKSSDQTLKEMSTFALGRLAQNSDNQAGIVQCGGLVPLLDLLESRQPGLQHNAAFALYGVADNEDDIPDIIKSGVLLRLIDTSEKLSVQASKDCVKKTINRIEARLSGSWEAMAHATYMLRSVEPAVRQRAALALVCTAPENELHKIFVLWQGLAVLLEMLVSSESDRSLQLKAAKAILDLAKRIDAVSPVDRPPANPERAVRLGSHFVNNSALADVMFIVDGRKFYAHRIALAASSDAFRAMFDGGYKEKDASSIEIPNISYPLFERMMTYIYAGEVDIPEELAPGLLQASDQYLVEGLKRMCEMSLAQALQLPALPNTFDLSESFNAPQLAKRCVLFTLEHFEEVLSLYDEASFSSVLVRMAPYLMNGLRGDLDRIAQGQQQQQQQEQQSRVQARDESE